MRLEHWARVVGVETPGGGLFQSGVGRGVGIGLHVRNGGAGSPAMGKCLQLVRKASEGCIGGEECSKGPLGV